MSFRLTRGLTRMLCVCLIGAAGLNCVPGPRDDSERYTVKKLVPPSPFHGLFGLSFNRFNPGDKHLYISSLFGQRIWKVNPEVPEPEPEIYVDSPAGQADDLAFAPDGGLYWTAFMNGEIRGIPKAGTPVQVIANDMPGINPIFVTKTGEVLAGFFALNGGLYRVPRDNQKKPELIVKLMGLNHFDSGADGFLYSPLTFEGKIVRIDVRKKTYETVTRGLHLPTAAVFESTGQKLYVVDEAIGRVFFIDTKTGAKKLVAQLPPGLDSLAFDASDNLFISSHVDKNVFRIGKAELVRASRKDSPYVATLANKGARALWSAPRRLSTPAGIAYFDNKLYVADLLSLRVLNPTDGVQTHIQVGGAKGLGFPANITVTDNYIFVSAWYTKSIQQLDRKTGQALAASHDFESPYDLVTLPASPGKPGGELALADCGQGTLWRIKPEGKSFVREAILTNLNCPAGLARGPGGLYMSETGLPGRPRSGRLSFLPYQNLAKPRTIARELDRPEGLAFHPVTKKVILAEVGKKRILAVDSQKGERRVIARDLAIGLEGFAAGPGPYMLTGVTISPEGIIYVSSDIENTIYEITAK